MKKQIPTITMENKNGRTRGGEGEEKKREF